MLRSVETAFVYVLGGGYFNLLLSYDLELKTPAIGPGLLVLAVTVLALTSK